MMKDLGFMVGDWTVSRFTFDMFVKFYGSRPNVTTKAVTRSTRDSQHGASMRREVFKESASGALKATHQTPRAVFVTFNGSQDPCSFGAFVSGLKSWAFCNFSSHLGAGCLE